MMKIIELDDDRVIAVRIDGRISDDEMTTLWDEIDLRLARHDTLRVFVEVEMMGMIGPEALLEDMRRGLRHFKRFERKAVVSDAAWMAKLAKVFDPVFPTIQLRTFPTAERDTAIAWVSAD